MHGIFVTYTIPDARAKVKKKQFEALGLKHKLGAVYLVDCYTIDAKLDKKQLEKAKVLLANPLSQMADKSAHYVPKFQYAIEIGFLPGVTDNIGHTAKETLADGAKVKFKPGQNVYSSQVFFISDPQITMADVKKIAASLHNPLIQRATITSRDEFAKNGLPVNLPKVKLGSSSKVIKVDLDVNDEKLVKLGKFGIPEFSPRRHPEGVHPTEGSLNPGKGILRPSDALGAQNDAAKRRGPLALSLEELKAIHNYFNNLGRQPTDIELETLAQTWSEHCKHTIFSDPMDELENGIYKTYIKAATEAVRKQKGRDDFCISVFTDNAGGISFDKDWVISHKVETHNTPSALDPFGGAITGIGGVNRDALGFGLGSKPIANFYGFCLGDPEDKTKLYRDKELQSPMLSSRRIMDGVIAGINAGGNQSGIPTPLGFLYFDDKFRGKPLVFAGTLGLIPKKIGDKKGHEKAAKPGDLIVTVGGRVGADGIHGATFASEGLDAHSPATAVQIGDPITQKKFSDAICKEARDLGLYNSITDCGAGGLSSAIGEMAGQSGDPSGSSRAKSRGGCEVLLDKAPVKYPGLAPWQIWISESQERMVLAVPKNKWQKFEKLMKSRGVEATVIGKFTSDGKCVVKYNNKIVLDVEMEFLHNGRPKKHLKTEKPNGVIQNPSAAEGEGSLKTSARDSSSDALLRMTPKVTNLQSSILNLLSNLNITSTEFVSTQYDHEVQGSSIIKPLQGRGRVNGEASAIRPLLNSQKGAVVSYGLHPSYSEISPYDMAACSIDSAISAAVAAGANVDYLALLDNFCWCSPDDPKRLWQLKEAARACFDYAVAFGTPFISGKDSMYNDFKGFSADGKPRTTSLRGKPLKISIPPTLLISALGIIPDVTKAISLDVKMPGDLIYILGETNNELGGSEFEQMTCGVPIYGRPGNSDADKSARYNAVIPKVDSQKNLRLYRSVYKANQAGLIASAINLNLGGLGIALSKTLIAGGLGAEISLADVPGDWVENYQALFSQSQGRILVSVDPKKSEQFEKAVSGNIFAKIGRVTNKPNLVVKDKIDKKIIDLNLNMATKAYKSTFKNW